MPKVSIIIPAFNAARYLPATLESVLGQSNPDFEIIVVDDGSDDGSPERVEACEDSRVRLVRLDPSGGPARPRNEGIRRSSAPYIALFDSDDLMQPDKIERQLAFYESQPDLGLVFTDFVKFADGRPDQQRRFLPDYPIFGRCPRQAVKENGYRILSNEAYTALLYENYIGTSGVMIRREILDEIGLFDESLRNSDDRDLWFRICRVRDVGLLDIVGHRYRVRPGSVSTRGIDAFKNRLEVFRRQLESPGLTEEMRKQIERRMGQAHFNIAYGLHREGRVAEARRAYRESLRLVWSWKTAGGLLKSALPGSLYRPGVRRG